MAASDDKPKISERVRFYLRAVIDFVFGIENKKGDVLDCQVYPAPGLTLSPQEFYEKLEAEVAAHKFPGLEITRQEFSEGGPLANRRTYLHFMRERLAITVCAAPFGDVFFFSYRIVYVRALVRLWHILAVMFCFGTIGRLLTPPLGINFATIATIALVFAIAAVLQNAATGNRSDLDTLLLKIPVVSTIYQDWFRVETYYREDTRNLYRQLLPQLIKELAEEACAAKGVTLESEFEPRPKVADLNRPQLPQPQPPAA